MKLDVGRVIERVEEFAFPRGTGSEGERRAADVLAGHLEAAGWRVVRAETHTGCRFSAVVMLLVLALICEAYLLWRALQVTWPQVPRQGRLVAFLVGYLAAGLLLRLAVGWDGPRIARERFAAWRARKDPGRLVNLMAVRTRATYPPTRVVILSHLDTPLPAGWEDGFWSLLLVVLVGMSCVGPSAVWRAWAQAALILSSVMFQARYWLRAGRPSLGDNRTGLALIAELARAIPSRLDERVEIRLAAVGGSALGQLGSLTLADEIRCEEPYRPTLVINVDAPGVGPELILVGTGEGLDVARDAARDLWIPHRVARWSWQPLDHRPFHLSGIASLSLVGQRKGSRIHEAGLAATAQLVTEMALRWARRQSKAPQDDNLARSSQNPG